MYSNLCILVNDEPFILQYNLSTYINFDTIRFILTFSFIDI